MTFLPSKMFLPSLLALVILLPGALAHSEDADAKLLLVFEKMEQGLLDFDGSDRFKNADFKLLSTERNDFTTPQRSLMALTNLAKKSPVFSEQLRSSEHYNHRHLLGGLTGHLSDIIMNDCTAADVYADTTYDDIYEPVCACIQDQGTGEIALICYLGDETCSGSGDGEVCSGTHEIFYFADADGDLDVKASCTFCRSGNCDGIREICTQVTFNANDDPAGCLLVEYFEETNSTQAIDPIVCNDCQICGTAAAGFGIQHSCFDAITDGCDKDALAHVHHFVPAPIAEAPIGGDFLETCSSSTPERELYATVTYADNYSAICDCEDPASGTIACDLHNPQCFANICTDITEVFFFNRDNGQYEWKWTLNLNTNFWTQTNFNMATGQATECRVLGVDPATDDLVACTACDICDTFQDGKGITHSCFGSVSTACDASDGRAQFNFPAPAKRPTVPGSSGLSPTGSVAGSPEEDNTLPLIMGIVFGSLAMIAIIVLVLQRGQARPVELIADDLTLAESAMDPIESEAGEPEFIIGNDEEMTLGSSVAPPPSEMDDDHVAGGSIKFEDGEMA